MYAAGRAAVLTLVAGMSTGLGAGVLLLLAEREGAPRRLAEMLAVAAGVMLHLSYADVLPAAADSASHAAASVAFVAGGAAFLFLLSVLPAGDGDDCGGCSGVLGRAAAYQRLSLMTAIGVSLHNFPEGIAVYVASLHDLSMALRMVVAVAAHNIPEGAAVALPAYYATGSKWQGLKWALVSGMCEPAGALLIGWPLSWWISDYGLAMALAAVAGGMVAIVAQELLPVALRDLSKERVARLIFGGVAAVSLMAVVQEFLDP
jgi:ZIP family zinc transporter